ncbi:MAG: molecular chaperone DnaJ, partial [Chloroflexota bacterium]|nr:molecular chaperone DnaJ [Chloroflexota bacterium]
PGRPPVSFDSVATTERDFYLILGVERTATDAELKRAFRKLAQQWHPDVNTKPEAQARFKEINEAYQVLSDPARRSRYDTFGRAGVEGADAGAGGFEGFGGFSDIFDAFFGGAGNAASARRGRPQPGADLRYDLRITFEEAVKGTEKEIEFSALLRCETCQGSGAKVGTQAITCPQCNGRGEVRSVRQTMLGQMVNVSACPRCHGEGKVVEEACETCRGEGRTERKRTLRVAIPAGIDEGHQIRLSNEGEVGPRGGPPGSLYVAVHVQPHASLTREGTELYYDAAISIAQAALGTRISVPTIEGAEDVEIKPGTQPNTEIRLRGKGVPHLRHTGQRGDLHVMVDVTVPTKLSKKARDLLAAYAQESGESVGQGSGGLLEKLGLG